MRANTTRAIRAAAFAILLATTTSATPVSITEALAQDPAPSGTVTIIETQECCESDKGIAWWPFLFAAAVPFAFIDRGQEIPPALVLPPPTSTETPPTHQPVPEQSTLSLALLAVAGFFLWRNRRSKQLVKAGILVMLGATATMAQQGNITIRTNVPVEVRVSRAQSDWSEVFTAVVSQEVRSLRAGEYAIAFTLPDGTTSERLLTVRKNCTTELAVTYRPPTCPTCEPLTATTPTILEQPKPDPESEVKPQPKPTRFDSCCGCKRDDLKARLDLFAIELHSNPTARGQITAPTEEGINYLVNQRRVDRERLELNRTQTNCVELWIIP
jgi:hypothetical protein